MRELAFRFSVHAADASARNRTEILEHHYSPLVLHSPRQGLRRRYHERSGATPWLPPSCAPRWRHGRSMCRFAGASATTVFRADWAFVATGRGRGAPWASWRVLSLYTGGWFAWALAESAMRQGLAMDAPLLAVSCRRIRWGRQASAGTRVKSNAGHERIAEQLGARNVRYGACRY
jgi:hypothetical protein